MAGTLLEEDIGIEWKDSDNVKKLALWLHVNFFIRRNAYARYKLNGSPSCIKDQVDVGVIKRHCTGKQTIGAYTTDPEDDCCIWQSSDIDWHDDDLPTPEGNLKFALAKWTYLVEIGLHPILEDSNGKGGYHLWLLWSRRLSAKEAYSFGHWLVRDHADYGIGKPEVFPKQPSIKKFAKDADDLPPASYGNQMRLPGKHPKREHWSRIWDGSRWLEGTEAIDYLLSRPRSDPALIPQEAREYVRPLPERRPCDPGRWDHYDDTEYWRNYDGDLRTLDIIKLFEEAGMLRGIVGGVQEVLCPWHEEHSTGEQGTAVWPAEERRFPGFNCLHSHCDGRGLQDVLAWFGKEKVDSCCTSKFAREPDPLRQEEIDTVDEIVTGGDVSKLPSGKAGPVPVEEARVDPRFRYLWEGNHGRYVSEEGRQKRIRSIKEVWDLIPQRGFVSEYIQSCLPVTDAPVCFHLGAALAVAGHVLNRKTCLIAGKPIYPNLWVALVGDSSVHRKSTAVRLARDVLEYDPHLAQTILPQAFSWESLCMQLGSIEEDHKGVPTAFTMCEEKERAEENFYHGAGLWAIDEIGGFLENLEKNYNQGGKVTLTEWYDCPRQWTKTTRHQGTYFVYRPCVSILGASTMTWLGQNCKESDIEGGFLPRWMMVTADRHDYILPFQDAASEDRLLKVRQEMAALKAFRGRKVLADDARDHFAHWRMEFEERRQEGLGGWTGRLGTSCLKVALIYQGCINPEADEVCLEAVVLAGKLVDWIREGLGNVIEPHLSFGPEGSLRVKVRNLIQRKGKASHRDVCRAFHRASSESIKKVAVDLEDQGYITIESGPKNGLLYLWRGAA